VFDTLDCGRKSGSALKTYSLSAVRIRAATSTAIPTDVTAKNSLGMRATMFPNPCATLATSQEQAACNPERNARDFPAPG